MACLAMNALLNPRSRFYFSVPLKHCAAFNSIRFHTDYRKIFFFLIYRIHHFLAMYEPMLVDASQKSLLPLMSCTL